MKISSSAILLLAASSPLSSAREPLVQLSGIDDYGEDVPTRTIDFRQIFNTPPKCKEYSMTFADRDFMDVERWPATYADGLGNPNIGVGMSWGLHALQWKALQHATATGGTYDVDLANASNPPARNPTAGGNHVSCTGGSERLDELENGSSGIFKTDRGSPVDPKGTWQCVEEVDALAGAILAAINMHHWNTPTYVDTSDGGVAVIEKVLLCVDGTEDPDVACNWDPPPGSSAGTCGTTSLVLDTIKLARFDGGGYYKDFTTQGDYYMDAIGWQQIYGKAGSKPVLVFDPPAGTTSGEIEALKHQAERIVHDSLLVPAEVDKIMAKALGGGLRG